MLQVKVFHFDLHKPKGSNDLEIENKINKWLKDAGNIMVITEESTPNEIGIGHIIWTIWYEDYNDESELDNTARSFSSTID